MYENYQSDNKLQIIMKSYSKKNEKIDFVPRLDHFDGMGKLQTVFQKNSRKDYNLFKTFLLI